MGASRSDGPSPSFLGVKVDLAPVRRVLNIGVPISPRKVDRAVNSDQVVIDTLAAAIEALRAPADVTDPRRIGRCLSVANDLAWLHGFLSVAEPGDNRGHRASPSPAGVRWPLLRRKARR